MKVRIQLGVESFTGVRRVVRLTPGDKTVEMGEDAGSLLLLAVGVADASDDQPLDGEVDFGLGDADVFAAAKPILKRLGLPVDQVEALLKRFAPEGGLTARMSANAFLRIRRV